MVQEGHDRIWENDTDIYRGIVSPQSRHKDMALVNERLRGVGDILAGW